MIKERFRRYFGVWPLAIASAPGRVNLIGEHTDYNDGFVLPMAIDRRVTVAAAPRVDDQIVAFSEEFNEQKKLPVRGATSAPSRAWDAYVTGLCRTLEASGIRVPGMSLLISGQGVPTGAGLSSSAALLMALARALSSAMRIGWEPLKMARLAQRAENDFVGVHSGIMDPVASAAGRSGNAMLLDCRSLEVTYVSVPSDVTIVVMDTGMRRALSETEYNDRRATCDAAIRQIRLIAPDVRALRDVSPSLLESAVPLLPATMYLRAKHVVEENARPKALALALAAGDFDAAGRLMNASHASLRERYEVSSIHLDIICDVARDHFACHGARMTGAGFGGCAIALVRTKEVDQFIRQVQPQYEARTYQRATFFAVKGDDGARLEAS